METATQADPPVALHRLVRHLPEYRYLGDFAACETWAARHMTCDTCRVAWMGCWDNFMCPKCGEGDLPGSEPTGMTLREMFEEAKSQPNVKSVPPADEKNQPKKQNVCYHKT